MDPQELYDAFVECARVSIKDNANSYKDLFRQTRTDSSNSINQNALLYQVHSTYVNGINDMLRSTAEELGVEFSKLDQAVYPSYDGLPIFKE